jgi:uncharacterized low-complexity protein
MVAASNGLNALITTGTVNPATGDTTTGDRVAIKRKAATGNVGYASGSSDQHGQDKTTDDGRFDCSNHTSKTVQGKGRGR